jgi:MFS transporter, PAT family, beta-lactamase induction signal transducer AmpG
VSRTGKLAFLSALYFAQGLPYGFQTTALPIYLRERGETLGTVGLIGAASFPWILKALWAPLVDRFGSARFGRRRSWLVPLQLLMTLACAVTALVHHSFPALIALVVVLNFLAATQDIVVDGIAIDLLSKEELGLGNAAQVCGYKVGMILSGGLLVAAFDRSFLAQMAKAFPWWRWATALEGVAGIFAVLTLLTACVLGVSLLWREPPPAETTKVATATLGDVLRTLNAAVTTRAGLWLLLFIGTYRLGESIVDVMFKPFLVDVGFRSAQLGLWVGTYGLVAGLVGSLLGGVAAMRGDVWRVVFWAALLRCLPLAAEAELASLAARAPLAEGLVIAVTCAEHFASGVLTTALFAFMMSRVDRSIGASHYTLLASVEVLGKFSGTASGPIAASLGYARTFALGTLLSVVLLAPLLALRPARKAA